MVTHGYGSGYGYGSGSGSGYGDGDGSGYGYGAVSGYGSGYGYYWRAAIESYVARWPVDQQKHFERLRSSGATMAYWTSTESGRPAHGGDSDKCAAPGVIEKVAGPLEICTHRALHASYDPFGRWAAARTWIVALIGEVREETDKIGALERVIVGECV